MNKNINLNIKAFIIMSVISFLYFIPVFFFNKSLLIEAGDHIITYIRMVNISNWIREGIIPFWDPKIFSGISTIDSVPTTHFLNLQNWIMALLGARIGYNIIVYMFVLLGSFGTYLLCHEKFGIKWKLSIAAGISTAFGPFIGNTYSSIFVLFPFISFYLYWYFNIFKEKLLINIIRSALLASIPLTICFYTQEPRFPEFMFHCSYILIIVALFIQKDKRKVLIVNGFYFLLIISVSFILLTMPVLFPLISETFHQKRLGAGEFMPLVNTFPGIGYLVNIIIGNYLPLNLSIFHNEIRLQLLGSKLTFYFEYVHILFYSIMAFSIIIYKILNPYEKIILWSSVLLKLIIVIHPFIPGFLYIWTYLFKTGRFIENDVSFFLFIILLFIIINKIFSENNVIRDNVYERKIKYLNIFINLQIISLISAISIIILLLFGINNEFFYAIINDKITNVINDKYYLINEFAKRAPLVLLSFMFLIFQLNIFKYLISNNNVLKRKKYYNILNVLMIATPIMLSIAYWPFNDVKDRTSIKSKDRDILNNMNILDRVDVIDILNSDNGLTYLQKKNIITSNEERSLQFAIIAYPPSMVSFLHHFIPYDIYDYLTYLYKNDKNFKRYSQSRLYFYPQDNNLFHLLGVDYFFSEFDLFKYPFKNIGKYGDYYLFKNEKAFPRFYYVNKIYIDNNPNYILRKIDEIPYDILKDTGFVQGNNKIKEKEISFNPNNRKINLIMYSPNVVTLESKNDSKQFLILNDTYDEKWMAFIDGQEEEIFKVNYLFRGVFIPSGKHEIKFIYFYKKLNIYLFITLLYLILLICILKIINIKKDDYL